MKNKNIGLDYKDENGNLRNELKNGVSDMGKVEGFSAEEFYFNLNKIIIGLDAEKSRRIAEKIVQTPRSRVLFGIYYYILKCLDKENKFEKEFDYLRQFTDYEFDIFMIANFIR